MLKRELQSIRQKDRRAKKNLRRLGLLEEKETYMGARKDTGDRTMANNTKSDVKIQQKYNDDGKKFRRNLKNCTFLYVDLYTEVKGEDEPSEFAYGWRMEVLKRKNNKFIVTTRVAAFSWLQLKFLLDYEGINYSPNKHIHFEFRTLKKCIDDGTVTREAFIDWKDDVKGNKDREKLGAKVYNEIVALARA